MSASPLLRPLFAVGPPGLEPLIHAELCARGFAAAQPEPGGVAFEGDPWRANALLALPTRILQRVTTYDARDFASLVRGAQAVDWRPFGGLSPQVTCHKSRLYHSDAVAQRLSAVVPDGPGALHVRLQHDRCTLSVDTSGERLHRRGWRVEPGAAPLRETLAAALLNLAGWQPGESLLDPMCGSGTLLIEAAVVAAGRWPGARRDFACTPWSPPTPLPERAAVPTRFFGGDRAPAALGAARRNAERAEVTVEWAVADAAKATPPTPEGLLVCNPPYGQRVGGVGPAWQRLAELLAGPFARWRAALVVPHPRLLDDLLRASERPAPSAAVTVDHGGTRVQLAVLPVA